MKKGLLGSTALVAATALTAGVASAAEAPTYSISGYVNFLTYFVSQDATANGVASTAGGLVTAINANGTPSQDDATMFMGVDEAEFHIKASGATDNGLTYGLTMQMNAANEYAGNSTGVSDEVYANVGGSWGTIEFGNNDGAEDTMATGAESIVGGVAGFDGEYGDVAYNLGIRGGPTIIGDTGDATKVTYYSPNFSGVTLGVSYTPNTSEDGPTSGAEGTWVDSIGLGAKFSGDVGGGISLTLSGVYVTESEITGATDEAASAWSVGGIVGFQQFQIAASYGDSGDSRSAAGTNEYSYWNVGASFENGPLYLSGAYHASTTENVAGDDTVDVISLTADYSLAPGLAVLAEVNLSSAENRVNISNDATTVIVGAKVSF